jgi:hypothetical protein
MKNGRGSPVRRVVREEIRTWVLLAVVVLLWMGALTWR